MLWDQTNDIYTMYGFSQWLDKQAADKPYVWVDCSRCLVGQYLTERLGKPVGVSEYQDFLKRTPDAMDADGRHLIAKIGIGSAGDCQETLGAARDRLAKEMAKVPLAVA